MKKEIEAFVNAANEQELEAAWNNLSAEEQRVFEQLMEEEPPEDALAFFAQLYDDTPKEQASETVSISEKGGNLIAKVGETVKATKLTGEGPVKRRIMDMGITKGVEIYVRKVAPLGDPVEVTVRGYELSLRKADAEMIQVE